MPQISKIAKQVNHPATNGCLKSPKSQNKSITRQEMVASNLQNRKTSQSSANKWLPQISKIAKQVNHPARNGCPKSPKSQNKSIKRQEMVASNLPKRRTSQSSGSKWLPQISKIAKQVNQASGNGCLKSPKSQNKSIKRQQMVAPNLQNRKTSQSPGRKWLPQISQNAEQVKHIVSYRLIKTFPVCRTIEVRQTD